MKYASGQWGGESWVGANVYFSPENCGLQIVATVEDDEPYQFYIVAAFCDIASGSLWLCQDGGCSCPVQFEHVRSFDDMTLVRSVADVDGFIERLRHEGDCPITPSQWMTFRRQIIRALREAGQP